MSATIATDRALIDGTWAFSPVHSSAGFSIKYLVASFSGGFDDVDASLENGKLAGSVDLKSIRVKDENLAVHLLAPDFFDAQRFPRISFESSRIDIHGERVELEFAEVK